MSDTPPDSRSVWRPALTDDGSYTLVQTELGQACHSQAGAWEEACLRYAEATRLRARAVSGELRVCRLLDVGTGLGWNLAAALQAVEGTTTRLEVVTLERDPSVWRETLELYADGCDPAAPWYASYSRVLSCLRAALAQPQAARTQGVGVPQSARTQGVGVPQSAHRVWFHVGAADATLPALAPSWRFDAVFLDAFSPQVDPASWQASFLAAIAARMRPGSWLSTYSTAIQVRVGLTRAGLRVGPGARVGNKASGTLASPDGDPGALEARVARKIARRVAAQSDG